MTKTGLILTTLVAAIPGAATAVYFILAFLNHTENMSVVVRVVSGAILLFSAFIALLPVLLFLLYNPDTTSLPPVLPAEPDPGDATKAPSEDDDLELEEDEDDFDATGDDGEFEDDEEAYDEDEDEWE